MADPDIRHHVADPTLGMGGQFNMLPSMSRFFFIGGGKGYSQTGWEGHGWVFSPGFSTGYHQREIKMKYKSGTLAHCPGLRLSPYWCRVL